MDTTYKDIAENNLQTLLEHQQRLILDGWIISEYNPGDVMGYGLFTVQMKRSEESIAEFKALAGEVEEKPKLTRNEILQKARDARGTKTIAKLSSDFVQ